MGWVYILTAGYCVIWLFLLRKLIGTPSLFPILRNSRTTRIFWIATFLLFNPLLSVLFVIFGLMLKPTEHPVSVKATRIIGLGLTASVILIFEVPFGSTSDNVRHWPSSKQNNPLRSDAHLDISASSQAEINLSSSSYGEGYFYTDRNQIVVINHSRHPILAETSRQLADHLQKLNGVELVTYYPADSSRHPSTNFPGLLIEFHEDRISGISLPFGGMHSLDVNVSVSTPRSAITRWTTLPFASFRTHYSIGTRIAAFGIFSPTVKHHAEANELLKIISQLSRSGLNAWGNFNQLPALPDYLYGRNQAPFSLPVQPELITMHLSGSDPLVHQTSLIRFKPDGSPKDTFSSIQHTLEKRGWVVSRQSDQYLRLTRNAEELRIKSRDDHAARLDRPLMEALYINHFTADEKCEVLSRFLNDENINEPALLILSRVFRKLEDQNLFASFADRVQHHIPKNLYQAIELGFVAEQSGQPLRAREMLKYACAYAQPHRASQAQWAMDDLAEKLGDPSLSKSIPELEFLEQCRIHPLPAESRHRTTGDDPLQFYTHSENGEASALEFISFKVMDTLWPAPPVGFNINTPTSMRSLYIYGRSDIGPSLFRQNGQMNDEHWYAEINNLYTLNGGSPLSIAVEESDHAEYQWVIKKKERGW